jgi:3'-phosphoadenosine 5'-phosphosulfate sulfotransferase (PAPS reductase)/FAD synthetase
MRRVLLFSGGLGSWAAGKVEAGKRGAEGLTLLFCDTRSEDEDLYRWLPLAAENVGAPLVTVADGRTVWEVFRDEGMIGNTRADICSRVLKREVALNHLKKNYDPADTVVLLGIGHAESHRFLGRPGVSKGAKARWAELGWQAEAPLLDAPRLSGYEVRQWAEREGIGSPRLYDLGFEHNNCGGACVKAGQRQWRHLLKAMPEKFLEWEREEEAFRQRTGKDVAILRDRRGGVTLPLPLAEFRRRQEAGGQCDLFDSGGCGCFADAMED